jgi:hypothetical protein
MDILDNYIELMGDPEFALYVAGFVFGLIFFIGLIGKLTERKSGIAKTVEPKTDPKKVEKPKEEGKPIIPPPSPLASLEGVMMWEGDSGKKKKNGTSPAPPLRPVMAAFPPAPKKVEKIEDGPVGTAEAPIPAVVAPATLSAGTPSSPVFPPEEKTVIWPPRAEPEPVSTPVPVAGETPSSPLLDGSRKTESEPPSGEKIWVDLAMYELLVRRIAALEADLKREPLYLDPLMKRLSNAEKRLESASLPGASAPAAGGTDGEVKDLREKVMKLQTLLENMSEGLSPDVPSPHP